MNNEILQHYQGYQLLIKQLQQGIDRYEKFYYPIEFDFYNPDSIEVIRRFLSDRVPYDFYGGYNGAIRKMLVIGQDCKQDDYLVCLAAKFNRNFCQIDNRDVKGALYNLGIDIAKTGDFFVQDSQIYLYCKKDISFWLINNFQKIANLKVDFQPVDFVEQSFNYDNFKVNVSSLRLDTVVSSIVRKSRQLAKEMINSGNVNVNFRNICQIDHICGCNDIISVKKYGRFKINDIQYNPKSGRIILSIDKYR
ncbi:MAG: YlmH/Sll1252 family protein [Erysipelotrichaceae bacterium]